MQNISGLAWEEGKVLEDCIKANNNPFTRGMVVEMNVRTVEI